MIVKNNKKNLSEGYYGRTAIRKSFERCKEVV